VVPHAHGGYSPAEQRRHDAVPHVHLSHVGHGHDHQHSGHERSHSTAAHQHSGATASLHGPSIRHDADAVYLPAGTESLLTAKRQGSDAAAQATWSLCLADAASVLAAGGRHSAPFHPPDGPARGGKLFLTLRTLRI